MMQSDYLFYDTSASMGPINWYASLPDHVKRLYDHKSTLSQQPIAMVVLAEVVCEAFTIWALKELFKNKKLEDLWQALSDNENKNKLRRLQDICNKDTHEIYKALSGDAITQAPFWNRLKKHSKRRNDLVHPDHAGPAAHPLPSVEDAEESFKAVEEYIQHVDRFLKSINT